MSPFSSRIMGIVMGNISITVDSISNFTTLHETKYKIETQIAYDVSNQCLFCLGGSRKDILYIRI